MIDSKSKASPQAQTRVNSDLLTRTRGNSDIPAVSRVFDTSTLRGLQSAERHQSSLYGQYDRVEVYPIGLNSVRVNGYKDSAVNPIVPSTNDPAASDYQDMLAGGAYKEDAPRVNPQRGSDPSPFDAVDAIIKYEQGDLDDYGQVQLFQHLVNTGLAWQLQVHYGRTAKRMLDAGIIRRDAPPFRTARTVS